MSSNWPLVGRAEELDLVHRAIRSTTARALVVAGQAGVGKTRLAVEALAHARLSGMSTAWAVATRSAASIPFGALAHLLPHPFPVAMGPANLLRSLAEAMVQESGGDRLLVGVDDAHLLDGSSAALVHHLAATGAAFVLATVRTGEPVPDAVRALSKDLGERLELQTLSRAEVETLVVAALGGEVDRSAHRELWEISQGNALLLRELIRGGLAAGDLQHRDGFWRWSGRPGRLPGLVELVESRLAAIDAEGRAAVEVVAAGEPLGLELAKAVAGQATLERLEGEGLVQTTRDRHRSTVSLSHPLFGEVVRASTPVLRTRTVVAELARALEATGTRRRGDLLRLGTWSVEAAIGDRPQLVLSAAGEAAVAMDFVLAERLASAVGDAGGFPGRMRLAEALAAQGRCEEADEVYAAAGRLAKTDDELAQLTVARATNVLFGLGRPRDAESILDASLPRITDPAFQDELAAWRSGLLLFSGRCREGLTLATALLDRPGLSARALMWQALVVTWGLPIAGRFRETREVSTRALEIMASHQPVLFHAPQLLRLREALPTFFEGRLSDALVDLEGRQEEAVERRWDPLVPMCAWMIGWILRVQGRVGSALQRDREAVVLLRELDWGHHLPDALAEVAHCSALMGDVVGAEAALAESEAVQGFLGHNRFAPAMAQVWTAAARGEVSKAVQLARQTAGACGEMGQSVFEAMALYDVARLGDARSAAGRLAELAATVEGELVPAFAAHAAALARRDHAALADASEALEAMGARLYAAEAAADASRAAESQGRKGTALGLAARARSLAAGCEGARTPALVALERPLPLTRREREVATLAALGLSNREIAERLVVSVRTAEGHLNQVFSKLGVNHRRQLRSILGE